MAKKEKEKETTTNSKQQERIAKEAHRKQKNKEEWGASSHEVAKFDKQLELLGLKLKDVKGDGNCLFRSLGDQINGDGENHMEYRERTAEYIASHRDDFEPFVGDEEGKNFEDAIANLSKNGVYAGNWALIGFSRYYQVGICIHQLDQPPWKIQYSGYGERVLHIAYFGYEHYSSVRSIDGPMTGPANIQMKSNAEKSTTGASTSTKSNGKDSKSTGISWMEQQIIDTTQCKDLNYIRSLLEQSDYNTEMVVEMLLFEKEEAERFNELTLESERERESEKEKEKEKEREREKEKEREREKEKEKEKQRQKEKQQQTRNLSNKERKEQAKKEKKERRTKEQQEEAKEKTSGVNEAQVILPESTIMI